MILIRNFIDKNGIILHKLMIKNQTQDSFKAFVLKYF